MLVYQRVNLHFPMVFLWFSWQPWVVTLFSEVVTIDMVKLTSRSLAENLRRCYWNLWWANREKANIYHNIYIYMFIIYIRIYIYMCVCVFIKYICIYVYNIYIYILIGWFSREAGWPEVEDSELWMVLKWSFPLASLGAVSRIAKVWHYWRLVDWPLAARVGAKWIVPKRWPRILVLRWCGNKSKKNELSIGFKMSCPWKVKSCFVHNNSTWWLIPRIVSGLVHPSYKWINPLLIPCQSLGL